MGIYTVREFSNNVCLCHEGAAAIHLGTPKWPEHFDDPVFHLVAKEMRDVRSADVTTHEETPEAILQAFAVGFPSVPRAYVLELYCCCKESTYDNNIQ